MFIEYYFVKFSIHWTLNGWQSIDTMSFFFFNQEFFSIKFSFNLWAKSLLWCALLFVKNKWLSGSVAFQQAFLCPVPLTLFILIIISTSFRILIKSFTYHWILIFLNLAGCLLCLNISSLSWPQNDCFLLVGINNFLRRRYFLYTHVMMTMVFKELLGPVIAILIIHFVLYLLRVSNLFNSLLVQLLSLWVTLQNFVVVLWEACRRWSWDMGASSFIEIVVLVLFHLYY